MKKYGLDNGIKILFEKNNSKSVSVEIMFNVGSNYDPANVAGISHFLEHMLFEGTRKRDCSTKIANEIEKYGAEFNAYTTGDRTAFFIKIINKRFGKALEILSDMINNSVFDEKIMEKEKLVILKEINMVTDDPRQHQWILFQRNLFGKPGGGVIHPGFFRLGAKRNMFGNELPDFFPVLATQKDEYAG